MKSLCCAILTFSIHAFASVCSDQLTDISVTHDRLKAEHLYADGSMAPSSPVREQAIAARLDLMNQEIFGIGKFDHPDIPSIEIFPADGIQVKQLVATNGTEIPRMEVSGIGPSGVMKATLLLPVSGHTGVENAKKWALTDTYHVNRDDSQNPTQTLLIPESKSLGSVTSHEVEIPLLKSGITRIYYYRSGSGGPGGFPSGRIYEILWNGN
jgi:hypothetical protein